MITQHSSKRRNQTCFISAPFGTDTSILAAALKRHSIATTRLDNLRPGTAVVESLYKAIMDADFVCAVLKAGAPNPNVFFELGVSAGAGKPLVILAEPEAQIPLDLNGILSTRVTLDNPSAVEQSLGSILDHIRSFKGTTRAITSSSIAINRARATSRLNQILNMRTPSRSKAAEEFVRELFQEANIVVSRAKGAESAADLAVWVDGVDPIIGNPLLIEVKTGNPTSERIALAQGQLLTYLGRGLGRAGILVWLSKADESLPKATTFLPLIFILQIHELIELLATKHLAKELVTRRNRAVHGIAP